MAKWKRKKWQQVEEDVRDKPFTPLGLALLEQFASGASGPSIQSLALAATKTGATGHDVDELASLGNFGTNPQHIAEQMVSKYCKSPNVDLPEPYLLDVPVLVKSNADCAYFVQKKQVAIFLPHDWFSWMAEDKHELVSGLASLDTFWEEHDLLDPKLEESPITSDDWSKYVPMVLHGDGGAFQRNDSINVLSMRSLLSAANVGSSQLLLFAIPKACIHKSSNLEEDTMHQVWKVLQWSFSYMFFGKHPEKDHLGMKWAPKSWRASKAGAHLSESALHGWLFAITGDGEYFQNEFKLKGASHNDCCFNCSANKSTIPHNDFRATAKWRGTVVRHAGTCPTDHLVSQVPGVVGECFAYDCLHVLEEGVAAHTIANCCFDFVIRPGWPGTQEDKCKALFHKVLEQYQELGIDSSNRIGMLKASNFCNPKKKYDCFPDLSGFKARQIRYLVPCFLEICKDQVVKGDDYTQHRMKCLENLEGMYSCMEAHHLHMPEHAFQAFKKYTDLCLQHYSRCSKISIKKSLLQWNTIHKHHLSAHLPAQAEFINPRFVTTYSGETMVGLMASLAHSCLNGTAAFLVPEKVCWRFRLGMWLRLANNDGED